VRADPTAGGLVPDEALPSFVERIGADHVLTVVGGAHSPHRLLPFETMAALLHALRG
jgi:hypothetical protein